MSSKQEGRMKRPAFQFYPADWRKDSALQSCSLAAQGLWVNLLCVMHECEPYGHLVLNGKPMNSAQAGRLVGLSAKEFDKLVGELEDAGVSSRSDEGVLFSRRMVKDEAVRNSRASGGEGGKEFGVLGAEHGKKGGRPPKARGVIYPPSASQDSDGRGVIYPPLEPPPSSSSSSSSSNTTHTMPDPSAGGTGVPDVCVSIVRQMQECGVKDAVASDVELARLIGMGADASMFVDAAAVAVGKQRGFGYALGVVRNKLADAAAGPAVAAAAGGAPAAPRVSAVWHESAAGVDRMAAELGLPPLGEFEQRPAFKARVMAAFKARQDSAVAA